MVITCDDFMFNDFQMTDYPLTSGNGSDGEIDTTDDMSLTPTATTVFIGENSTNRFISQKYESKNEFTVRLAKEYCQRDTEDKFSENELRMYNRLLTGKKGYSWLKIVNFNAMETDYYYRARVSKIEYERLGYDVVGYDVTFECDGGMAYSEEQKITITVNGNTPFAIFCNSDELNDYVLPVIKITANQSGTLLLTNSTDTWTTRLNNMTNGETVTIDSEHEILTSTRTRQYILTDFNMHWPRLLPGKNLYTCTGGGTVEFTFRAVRKVGFVS